MGTLLLTAAMERDGKLKLEAYDRMFPCQDTLPKGGFGNLIALPLDAMDFYGIQQIKRANMMFLPLQGFSPRARNRLTWLAAFQNPEFYRAQAMRLPVYNKPRIVSAAEERDGYLALPRGCESKLRELLDGIGVSYEITDRTFSGKPLHARFLGELWEEQRSAADALLEHDTGVLSATTAFGKTVVAAYLIAQRKVSTLILVHTQSLLDQWKRALAQFLAIDEVLPELPK